MFEAMDYNIVGKSDEISVGKKKHTHTNMS